MHLMSTIEEAPDDGVEKAQVAKAVEDEHNPHRSRCRVGGGRVRSGAGDAGSVREDLGPIDPHSPTGFGRRSVIGTSSICAARFVFPGEIKSG
jgi:hypothetical protein